MPITHIRIENFKSIKRCDMDFNNLTMLIGANGSGKTNVLEAIKYFFDNLTEDKVRSDIFDANNKFSNQIKITLTFDLSNFVMISKNQTNDYEDVFDDQIEKSKYGDYFKSIISLVSTEKEKKFTLQLSQIKGRGIMWSETYEKRIIIKSLFPLFYIDTRNLDINEWSKVWNVLGELAKVSNAERELIQKQVRNIIDYDSETSNKIKAISSIFDSSELSVVSLATKDYASMLAKIYFSGDTITQKGKGLRYYSSGTNSVKYIEVLLRSINEITRNKMKEPVILLDEPEISLHPNFIDELSEVLALCNNKMVIVLSTHSSRLIKRLISFENMYLYNVKTQGEYTVIGKMRRFQQYSPTSKYRVLDDHINSYFSRGILFVEGETELELFSNPYLQILFPQLKTIDVFKAMSQEPILNIMNPSKNSSKIPYICLVDADKTIQFDRSARQFKLRKEYFENNKEKFFFRNKKYEGDYLHHTHLRINNMVDKLKIHYYEPFFSCNDINYYSLISTIHDYLLFYGVFTFKTTVEGALVNERNISYALSFLRQLNKDSDFEPFMEYFNSHMKTDQMNILRIVFKGKSDLLINYGGKSGIKKQLSADKALILDKVMIGEKTSGWVSDYIDQFFSELLPDDLEHSPKVMKKLFDDDSKFKSRITREFEYKFPELFDLFSKICDIIS